MKTEEIITLVSSLKQKAASITDNHVITILQKIRTDVMATHKGIKCLIKLACVPVVLKLLYRYSCMDKSETDKNKTTNENTISVAVSIIANILTDKSARQQVNRHGIEILVSMLTDCSSEMVKIRCCRALANLAMDAPVWTIMFETQVIPALVMCLEIQYVTVEKTTAPETTSPNEEMKPLAKCAESEEVERPTLAQCAESEEIDWPTMAKFPSGALVENACRALRYLFGDKRLCQQFVKAGALRALATLFKCDEASDSTTFILKALHRLWTKWISFHKRITEGMAKEMAHNAIISKLLELTDSQDDNISEQAVTVLLPLAEYSHSAAVIDEADGVKFLISHRDSKRKHINNLELITALCWLPIVTENPGKILDCGGLKVLLETLQDDTLETIHDLAICSILSVQTFDSCLTVLLKDGLLDVLLVHLQRIMKYKPHLSTNLFESAQEIMALVDNVKCQSATQNDISSSSNLPSFPPENCKTVCFSGEEPVRTDVKNESFQSDSASKTVQKSLAMHHEKHNNIVRTQELSSTLTTQSLSVLVDICEEKSNVVEELQEEDGENADQFETGHAQLYSMHSPSYQAESTWRMEDYNPGVTCKYYYSGLSPNSAAAFSDDSSMSFSDQYSPQSTPSYYSPPYSSHSSPSHFSSPSSPASSNSEFSSPDSPHISGEYTMSKSLSETSLESAHCGSPDMQRSSFPFETVPTTLVFSSSDSEEDENRKSEMNVDNVFDNDASGVDVPPSSDQPPLVSAGETVSERRGSSVGKKGSLFFYDENALGDTSDVLETSQSMIQPNGKRFFRPNSLHQIHGKCDTTKQCAQGIYSSDRQKDILNLFLRVSHHSKLKHHLCTNKLFMFFTDFLASADKPQSRGLKIVKGIIGTGDANSLSFIRLLRMCAPAQVVNHFMLDSDLKLIQSEMFGFYEKDGKDSEDWNVSWPDRPAIGNILLKQLNHQSYINTGQIHRLLTGPSDTSQLMCLASLLFLSFYWTMEERLRFLFKLKLLEKVMSALCTQHSGDSTFKDVIVLGLVYFAHCLDIPFHYQCRDKHMLFDKAFKAVRHGPTVSQNSCEVYSAGHDRDICHYNDAIKDFQIVVNENGSQKLAANRDVLIMNCSFFSSMLSGKFMESARSEVCLYDTCPQALKYVLHYLHGCDGRCSVIKSLHQIDGFEFPAESEEGIGHSYSKDWFHCGQTGFQETGNDAGEKGQTSHLLCVIVLADQYLLHGLVQYLCRLVSCTLEDGKSASEIFVFAALHCLNDLAEDCIKKLLLSSYSLPDKANAMIGLAQDRFGSELTTYVLSIFRKGVEKTLPRKKKNEMGNSCSRSSET